MVLDAELVPQYSATIRSGGEQEEHMTIFALDGGRVDRVLNTKVGKKLSGEGVILLQGGLMAERRGFMNAEALARGGVWD